MMRGGLLAVCIVPHVEKQHDGKAYVYIVIIVISRRLRRHAGLTTLLCMEKAGLHVCCIRDRRGVVGYMKHACKVTDMESRVIAA